MSYQKIINTSGVPTPITYKLGNTVHEIIVFGGQAKLPENAIILDSLPSNLQLQKLESAIRVERVSPAVVRRSEPPKAPAPEPDTTPKKKSSK